jgi:glycosyltransferase involved in cell wall biosynthesis
MAASMAKVPIRIISRRVDFPLKKNILSRKKCGKNIDAIIAISRGVKRVLIDSGIPSKLIEVIPSGIDFSPFDDVPIWNYLHREFNFAPDDYLVGIVAHLADHKGHKYLIKATQLLREQTDKIRVIVVGEGPLRLDLTKKAKELNVDDIVYFLGFREDVPQILSSLDLFVLSSYLEGMGSSLLDAMACSLPIVATQVGGIPEVVINDETGILVPPRNPSSLAKAILKLYHDKDLATRLGQRGNEVVRQKFSAEAMADKIIDVYERIALRKGVNLK